MSGDGNGELAEWLMAAVLKTVDLNGFGGSNPSLSARKLENQAFKRFTHKFTHTKAKFVRNFFLFYPTIIVGN